MAISPKKALELLTTGAPVPGFDEASVSSARALVAAPSEASAETVAALPAPLALAVLESSVRGAFAATGPRTRPRRGRQGARPRRQACAAPAALRRRRGSRARGPRGRRQATRRCPSRRGTEELPCLLTPMDGSGDYGLFLVRPLTGQVEMVQVLVNDELGVQELGRIEGPRSQYRKLMRSLVRDEKAPVVELDAAAARQELGWAVAASIASHTPFPEGLHTLLRHHEAEPSPRPDLPPPEADDEALAARAETLFAEPLLAPWLPPETALRRVAERLGGGGHQPPGPERSPEAPADPRHPARRGGALLHRAHAPPLCAAAVDGGALPGRATVSRGARRSPVPRRGASSTARPASPPGSPRACSERS